MLTEETRFEIRLKFFASLVETLRPQTIETLRRSVKDVSYSMAFRRFVGERIPLREGFKQEVDEYMEPYLSQIIRAVPYERNTGFHTTTLAAILDVCDTQKTGE